MLGCTGCRGNRLDGDLFTKDNPQYGPLYASNLTVLISQYSDAQLDGIIRNGTHHERQAVWGMPSQIFHNLSDADFRAVVAYLPSLKPIGTRTPPPHFSAQDRKDIASGDYKAAAEIVPEFAKKQPIELGPRYALGRYLASVTCEKCRRVARRISFTTCSAGRLAGNFDLERLGLIFVPSSLRRDPISP